MRKIAKFLFCVSWLISNGALSASVRENNVTTATVRPLRSNDRAYFDNELSKIDAHRQRYFDLESEIWREVKKSDNQAVALRKIHEKHLAFYADHLEYGVDMSLFETGEKDLLTEVKFINDSVLSVAKKTLHKNERNFARTESVELAGRHREFIRAMDAIYNITKDNDFFLNIKKVNIFDRNQYVVFVYRRSNDNDIILQTSTASVQCLSMIRSSFSLKQLSIYIDKIPV